MDSKDNDMGDRDANEANRLVFDQLHVALHDARREIERLQGLVREQAQEQGESAFEIRFTPLGQRNEISFRLSGKLAPPAAEFAVTLHQMIFDIHRSSGNTK